MSCPHCEIEQKQKFRVVAENERLREGIDFALGLIAAGNNEMARKELIRVSKRGHK